MGEAVSIGTQRGQWESTEHPETCESERPQRFCFVAEAGSQDARLIIIGKLSTTKSLSATSPQSCVVSPAPLVRPYRGPSILRTIQQHR